MFPPAKHILIFLVLLSGALAFYFIWDLTTAVVFFAVGMLLEGSAYWWASRSGEETASKLDHR